MILIKNLTKKYRSKNQRTCTALNSVNLTLPDTGMIFIIGKSGSGKSTLLNMIGGLDGFNSGTIIAGGNDLAKFKHRDAYKYRASYVGFIFQDYHLIEELTVAQNINLEAEIANAGTVDIEKALKSVDLEGYGARFPDELSGGQKQRVAIARALIKSPSVILCDEPTGNLDKNTSTQIMDLLYEISKERLVVIVSHNMPDAEKYGDRIIELSDGRVIKDVERRAGYINKMTLQKGILTVPYNHNLTKEETSAITAALEKGEIKSIVQNDGGYINTKAIAEKREIAKLKSPRLKPKTTLRLFSAFSRVGRLRTATTAFISAVMVVLLIIFQSFLMFDGSSAIADSLKQTTGGTVVLKKDTYIDEYGNSDNSRLYKITDDDLSVINEICGSDTKTYLLYNYSITVNPDDPAWKSELEQQYPYDFKNKHIYTAQMPGTLVCDKEYLINKFGKDGALTVLAGDIENTKNSAALILTDYLADAIMLYNPIKYRSYQDLIGNHENRAIVAAVIDTGYKSKYAELIKQIAESKDEYSAGINSISKEDAMTLLDDIKNNLSIAYNLNPNFHAAAVSSNEKYYSRTAGFTITSGEKSVFIEKGDALRDQNGRLNPGEILISDDILKQLYPDKNKEDFTLPMEVTMKRYEYPNDGGEVLAEFTFTVVGITYPSYFHEEDYRKMKEIDIIPFAVYVENPDSAGELVEVMKDRYFSWSSTEGNAVALLNKSVNMFFDLFRLIEIMMLVMTVVFLVSYSIRSIKSNYYQIGVIKAIGGRSSDIGRIFIMQNALLSFTVSILTYIGSIIFIDIANDILIKSFTEITNVGVGNINIISFNLPLVILAMAATIVLGLISTVAPLLYLHNIKPINIIKAKE